MDECSILGGSTSDNCIRDRKKPNQTWLFISVAIVNQMFLISGLAGVWSSPVLLKLRLSYFDVSTVASMLPLGIMAGPLVSAPLMNILGRKYTLGIGMMIMTISCLVLLVGRDVIFLSVGRFLAGMTSGIVHCSVPSYIAEISEDSTRGYLNTLSFGFSSCGGLLMYAVGPFLCYTTLHYMMTAICVCFFLVFPLLPESPYFLVMKKQDERARNTLIWLRGANSGYCVEHELVKIQTAIEISQNEKSTIRQLFTTRGNRRALAICCLLMVFQQLSGASILFYYMQLIFHKTHTGYHSSTCSIIIGVIKTASAFISPVAVKKFGYKKPMLISTFGMIFGMAGLGIFFMLESDNFDIDSIQWLPLLSVIVYIVFFSTGFVNIPWALSGEYFSSALKPYATAIVGTTSGFTSFLFSRMFAYFLFYIGLDYLFLSCACFCFVSCVFIFFTVLDTSGMSFVEIQKMLNGHRICQSV